MSSTLKQTIAFIRTAARISRSTWLRVLLLVGPLTLQVLLFKLIKHAVLVSPTHTLYATDAQADLASTLFVAYAATPLLLLALAVLPAFLLLLRRPSLGLLGLPVFAASFLGLAALSETVLPPGAAWLSWTFAGVIRWDVCGALLLAGLFLPLIEHTRGRARAASLALLHGLVLVLMLLSSLEFGYFAQTGSFADAHLLRYFLSNLKDLSYVLSYEVSGTRLAFLFFPFVVVLLPVLAARPARRRAGERETGPPPRRPASLAYVLLPALALFVLPGAAPPPALQPIAGNAFLRLFGDLFTEPIWASQALEAQVRADAPPFDTRSLRFAATDRFRPMNVVFLVLESQRSPARHPRHVTPFLDALERQALVVDEMYAVMPHTNKALVPVLCGIYPRIRQGGDPAVPGVCLPALLKPLGYTSAFFTPATLAFEDKGALLKNMGFDEVFGDDDYDRRGFDRINYFGSEDRIMLAPSLAWVDRRLQQRTPFLLTYLTLAPHHPYTLSPTFEKKQYVDAPADYNDYLNALAYVDAFLADLFAAFQERGLMDSTLFVIVGDHGEAFGEHGRRHHSAVVWEEGLHVRALLYHPRLFPEATHVHGPRQQTDLLPTVADLLGVEMQEGFLPGTSLLQPVPADRKLYHAGWIENQSMALRQGTLKFIYHYRREPMEVYDLASDPLEKNNLADRYTPEQLDAVEFALLLWRRRVNDQYRE